MIFIEQKFPPFDYFAKMRETAPVFFNLERGVWELYCYNDIKAVLGDPATFSSAVFHALGYPELQTMVGMDAPRHTKFRKLLSVAFTSKMVKAQAPHIYKLTDRLIDKILGKGEVDILKDIAFPLPSSIIAVMLGVPQSDVDLFEAWAVQAFSVGEHVMQRKPPPVSALEGVKQLTDYLAEFAIKRRADPQDDLMSALAMAEVDGERLTIEEISNTGKLLLVAGFDTTKLLIGNSMHILLQDQEMMAQLRSDPTLFDDFVEEVLRFTTPFQFATRIATRDVEIGGQLIKKGQWVMAFLGSGNRDAAVFENPDSFDMRRAPNRHLGFGYGIHLCLGAPLGRLEAKIAVEEMLKRLPNLRLNPDKPVAWIEHNILQFGFTSLPAIFSAG